MSSPADFIHRSAEFSLHPLGFFYLRVSHGKGATQRIHIWPHEGDSSAEHQYHTHSFGLRSKILAGRIKNELFAFDDEVSGDKREYFVSYEEQRSRLEFTGRTGYLRNFASFECSRGEEYSLSAGIIHRVTVLDRPCITFLRTFEENAPVLCYGNDAEEAPFVRRSVSDDEALVIEELLRSVE